LLDREFSRRVTRTLYCTGTIDAPPLTFLGGQTLAPGTRDNRNVFCADSCSPFTVQAVPTVPASSTQLGNSSCTELESATQSLRTSSHPLFRPLLAVSPAFAARCSPLARCAQRSQVPLFHCLGRSGSSLCSSKHQAASGSSVPPSSFPAARLGQTHAYPTRLRELVHSPFATRHQQLPPVSSSPS